MLLVVVLLQYELLLKARLDQQNLQIFSQDIDVGIYRHYPVNFDEDPHFTPRKTYPDHHISSPMLHRAFDVGLLKLLTRTAPHTNSPLPVKLIEFCFIRPENYFPEL